MRYLRSSIYISPSDPPLSTVLSEAEAVDTLESARVRILQPGALVIHDIFESDGDLGQAVAEAMERQRSNQQQESHQALLYHWTILQWVRTSERGMVLMDQPAPLSREEICVVFDQLAQHPDYGHRTVVTPDRNGVPVLLVDGEIKEDE